MPARRLFLIPLAATLALALPRPAAAETRDWNRAFDVSASPRVSVRTEDGRVRVRTGRAGRVEARVHWESKRWGFTSPSREPEVSISQLGDGVEVYVREPMVFVAFGGRSERIAGDVTVPPDCDLRIRTGDGSITVEDPVEGDLDLTTGDGHVTLNGARGEVRLTSGDGPILAHGLDGDVVARTRDGRVTLDGRFDALEVRTGDGHVDVTVRRGSRLREDWSIETRDGPLAIAIPKDLRAELDAATGDGRIHFDLPVTVRGGLDPHAVHGRLNGGGPRLRLRTGDGSLTLAASE